MDIETWILDWFRRRGTLEDAAGLDAFADKNIFESGLLDSFGVIELIGALEQHFGIAFDERDFQDRRFPYVRGLSEMIRSMLARQAVS